MKTSGKGRAFVESSEGFAAASYKDQRGIWTIGFGHTSGVGSGMTCTRAQSDAWMSQDLGIAEKAVNELDVALNQDQFDALVSLAYNIGASAFSHSMLATLLKQEDYSGAANQFLAWCRTDGHINQGLLNRRRAEMEMFKEKS